MKLNARTVTLSLPFPLLFHILLLKLEIEQSLGFLFRWFDFC